MDVEETKELEARTDTPKSLDEVILDMKGFGIEEGKKSSTSKHLGRR